MIGTPDLLYVGALLYYSALIVHGFAIAQSNQIKLPQEQVSDDGRSQQLNFNMKSNFLYFENNLNTSSLTNEPTMHVCLRDRCQVEIRHTLSERNCECDGKVCFLFGDCCMDAKIAKKIAHLRSWWNTCMAYGRSQENAMYVVGTCPGSYGESKIKRFCEGEDDFSDPLLSAPVTNIHLGLTFRNRYCALCTGHLTSGIRSWTISPIFKKPLPRIPHNYYIDFNFDSKKWGVYLDSEFYDFEFRFEKPRHIPVLRECRPNVISSCPSTYKNERNVNACGSYMSVVHSGGRLYKNFHCAVCNGERNVSCMLPLKISKRNAGGMNFRLLMDFNWAKGSSVGLNNKCEVDSIYDPFSFKCRNIICIFDGYELINGKCRKKSYKRKRIGNRG